MALSLCPYGNGGGEMKEIFLLLVLFQIKHFLCDFPLQGKYMLGKFKVHGWQVPLLAHASVHGAGTLAIIAIYSNHIHQLPRYMAALALADILVHFTVDRIKASPNLLGRWKPDNKYFWWALGADQAAHHFTHYAIISVLVWGKI